jgi:hypothetical protein
VLEHEVGEAIPTGEFVGAVIGGSFLTAEDLPFV